MELPSKLVSYRLHTNPLPSIDKNKLEGVRNRSLHEKAIVLYVNELVKESLRVKGMVSIRLGWVRVTVRIYGSYIRPF